MELVPDKFLSQVDSIKELPLEAHDLPLDNIQANNNKNQGMLNSILAKRDCFSLTDLRSEIKDDLVVDSPSRSRSSNWS